MSMNKRKFLYKILTIIFMNLLNSFIFSQDLNLEWPVKQKYAEYRQPQVSFNYGDWQDPRPGFLVFVYLHEGIDIPGKPMEHGVPGDEVVALWDGRIVGMPGGGGVIFYPDNSSKVFSIGHLTDIIVLPDRETRVTKGERIARIAKYGGWPPNYPSHIHFAHADECPAELVTHPLLDLKIKDPPGRDGKHKPKIKEIEVFENYIDPITKIRKSNRVTDIHGNPVKKPFSFIPDDAADDTDNPVYGRKGEVLFDKRRNIFILRKKVDIVVNAFDDMGGRDITGKEIMSGIYKIYYKIERGAEIKQ